MIHTRALLKTLGFMFLPSLSVLIILFFWFFSLSAFIAFITSATAVAGVIRLAMILLEFIVGYNVYTYYKNKFVKEEILENKETHLRKMASLSFDGDDSYYKRESIGKRITEILELPDSRKTNIKLEISETADPNKYLIEKQVTHND